VTEPLHHVRLFLCRIDQSIRNRPYEQLDELPGNLHAINGGAAHIMIASEISDSARPGLRCRNFQCDPFDQTWL